MLVKHDVTAIDIQLFHAFQSKINFQKHSKSQLCWRFGDNYVTWKSNNWILDNIQQVKDMPDDH